jgi:uncharacterized membrane protein
MNILLVGESCVVHSTEFKGYDNFFSTRYSEPAKIFMKLFADAGHEVTHIPCHRVPFDFPNNLEAISEYDVVLFSDVGSNTFLLHPDTARLCKRTPNLLKLVREYVAQGGGFGMIGGYMTFQGIEAKGRYKDSVIEEILPVTLLPYDDRVEVPEGADLIVDPACHGILEGFPKEWPFILGYNKLIAKKDADVIVSYEGDPIITLGKYDKGRTLAYATDCAPHWAPPEMHEWEHYGKLWNRLVAWLANNE